MRSWRGVSLAASIPLYQSVGKCGVSALESINDVLALHRAPIAGRASQLLPFRSLNHKLPPQQIRGGFSVQYSGSAINLSLEFRTLVRTVRRPAYVNLPMA
ncbi:hypothetical protein CI102_1189 [Trichoderma harzianum]|nr:hypothetical protein CI102_1189 [Trichoderma harzianum]